MWEYKIIIKFRDNQKELHDLQLQAQIPMKVKRYELLIAYFKFSMFFLRKGKFINLEHQ
jgi:hypothetical protein